MPEWSDTGLILSVRRFAEHDAIVSFLTQNHGRSSGLSKGAFSKKNTGVFQPGNLVKLSWKARLEEHLGTVSCDLMTSYAVSVMDDADRLTALSCICSMAEMLPERETVYDFFQKTLEQIVLLQFDGWMERYAKWEIDLLEVMGFGLDLSSCAVTGQTDELVYVSPKSGKAVSAAAGKPWHDRLLPLPSFLKEASKSAENDDEIKNALQLTGFFLENHAAKTVDCRIPAVRARLVERLSRISAP